MTDYHFSDHIIQAISDWQRGGNPAQKERRGVALKNACTELPDKFRRTMLVCFRQLALCKSAVWHLHDALCLAETISSWTLVTDVAKAFKGGVPPEGLQGVILDIVPPAHSVIVNLDALYRDEAFRAACDAARSRIDGFGLGIATYGNAQNEIVLELQSVPMSSVYALGGHSGSREEIARLWFGHEPTPDEWEEFLCLVKQSEVQLGPRWISGAAKDRVLTRTLTAYGILKPHHPSSTSPD
jgi:hypothetical protein